MPNIKPPVTPPGTPELVTLQPGTDLFRIHNHTRSAVEYNDRVANSPWDGGRFDSADGSYSYLYAGDSARCAVAERLLRDIPAVDLGNPRTLEREAVKRLSLTRITVTRPLPLVSLHGTGAHAIGQSDGWLTTCDSQYYPHTRGWAAAIRDWSPGALGFEWHPRHDSDAMAYVLFGDAPGDALHAHRPLLLRNRRGHEALEEILAQFQVLLAR